jgi:hypothetical protein
MILRYYYDYGDYYDDIKQTIKQFILCYYSISAHHSPVFLPAPMFCSGRS